MTDTGIKSLFNVGYNKIFSIHLKHLKHSRIMKEILKI